MLHTAAARPTPPLRTGLPAIGAFWRKIRAGEALGMVDQVLISGTNFVTMVIVGRGLGKAGFGEFSLIYNLLLFANMIQATLVTQPHNVFGGARENEGSYASYTASTAMFQAAIAALQAACAIVWAIVAFARGWHCTGLLVALIPSILAWQFQEFFRRVLYTEGRTAAVVANDLLSYGGQAVWIVILAWLDRNAPAAGHHYLTGPAAMYVLATTSAAGTLLGYFQVRPSLRGKPKIADCIENWNFGKWLLGSELLTYFSSLPMYMNLVWLLVNEAASGELKAAQTLFGPARVISFYLATVLPIQFAKSLTAGGPGEMHRQLKQTSRVVLPLLATFCLLIAAFAGPLLRIFGRDFGGNPNVLTLYAFVAFLTYSQMILIAALTAKRLTHVVFFSSLWGAAVTLLFSWVLIKAMGIYGALVGMILTGAAMTAMYWIGYSKSRREDP